MMSGSVHKSVRKSAKDIKTRISYCTSNARASPTRYSDPVKNQTSHPSNSASAAATPSTIRAFPCGSISNIASGRNARARSNADVLIPYSDHADFSELLTLIAESNPSQIDIVHGYAAPLAHILRQRGYNAREARL